MVRAVNRSAGPAVCLGGGLAGHPAGEHAGFSPNGQSDDGQSNDGLSNDGLSDDGLSCNRCQSADRPSPGGVEAAPFRQPSSLRVAVVPPQSAAPLPMKKLILALCAASLTLAACSSESNAAPTKLRFSVIPDFKKSELQKNCDTLAAYLTDKLGIPVEYQPSNDYAGAVQYLVGNKVDFVWLGGKTTCDAIDEGNGEVDVIATRDIDLTFKTYFIANKKLLDAGKLTAGTDLDLLKANAKDLTFTFGSKDSTSGHLMPRFFMLEAGIDPDAAFKNSGYQASGGHSATLSAVASGATDVGALNFTVWDKASDDVKQNAPIIYTTPGYVDYAWCAHKRIGAEMMQKLTDTLVNLDKANPADAKILEAWSAKARFVRADAEKWDSIRKVRDSLPKGFLQ